MPTFDFRFTVAAPLAAVAEFHQDTAALKKLTPPPIFAQIHQYEPLAEGSVADFTLWFGPLPVPWRAVHTQVEPAGFTDSQLRGPLKSWQHTHRFAALAPALTEVREHIEYEHARGWRGLFSRLLFARPGLYLLFTARKFLARYHVNQLLVAADS
jgi:ligand-binding SRPBCC domain-containing protein